MKERVSGQLWTKTLACSIQVWNTISNVHVHTPMDKIFCHSCLQNPVGQSQDLLSMASVFLGMEHILAFDCSKEYDHAVLAKEVNGLKHITIFHKMTKISLTPTYSSYKLEVHGQEIEMIENTLV